MHSTGSVKLSIIIVNYKTAHLTMACVGSILNGNQDVETEIFVVDNCSSDGSVGVIRQRCPEVHLIANDRNLGFARANNLALRRANGEYVLILNPDTVLAPGTLRALLEFLDAHPEIGILTPKLVRADGSMDLACRRSFPTSLGIFLRLAGIDRLFPRSRLFGHYNLLYVDPSVSREVDCVSGAFMLARSQAIDEVGLLDERFFMYAEDVDWCHRFRLAGWRAFYFADIEVLHYKGESAKQEHPRMIREFYKAAYQCYEKYYAERNRPLFNRLMKLAMLARMTLGLVAHDVHRMSQHIAERFQSLLS